MFGGNKPTGFTFGTTPSTQAPQTGGFSFGTTGGAAAGGTALAGGTAPAGGFNFGGTPAGQPASSTKPTSGGFNFGTTGQGQPLVQPVASSTAPGSGGFNIGTPTATSTPAAAPTGISLGGTGNLQATAAATAGTGGFSFSATVATTSGSTAPTLTGLAGVRPIASKTTAPAMPATGGFNFAQPVSSTTSASTTTSTLGTTLGLKIGTASTAPGTTTGLTSTITSAAPIMGLFNQKTTAATSTVNTSTATSVSSLGTTTTTTVTPASTQKKMNYQQLEDSINKWQSELEKQEKDFLEQATQVNAWDRLLIENGEKITALNSDMERVKIDQQKLDHELDFIKAQQQELEELLVPLEKSVDQQPTNFQQHADLERENTYQLAENVDAQLKRMVQDLKEIIDHLNTTNTSQDNNDPIQQITKILNSHMDSLQWIDQNSALLTRKVDDISKQMEMQRKEQERNFRLVYN